MTGLAWVYAKARGVTAAGIAGYLMVWLVIAGVSRLSISALGLQFAPWGSSPLDTVAMVLMVVPVTIIGRCVGSEALSLEATRSRPRQPYGLLWAAALAITGLVSPTLVLPLLHRALDRQAFLASWCLLLGLFLVLGALVAVPFAAAGVFAVVAVFSTPRLVPWEANVFYNVELAQTTTLIGGATILVGIVLAGLRSSRAAG